MSHLFPPPAHSGMEEPLLQLWPKIYSRDGGGAPGRRSAGEREKIANAILFFPDACWITR
jgi:hypothetical protein